MTNEHDMTAPIPSTRPALENRPTIKAYECAPIGLDGHRWPCPAAETAGAECADQGCGVGVEDAVEKVVVFPEVTIPASAKAAIPEAKQRVAAIAQEVSDLAEFIGVEVGQYMLVLSMEVGAVSGDLVEAIFEELGWEELQNQLGHLGDSLSAAGGWDTHYSDPEWSRQLARSWKQARLAFIDPESDEAAMHRRHLAVQVGYDQVMAEAQAAH